uniref:F-box domain-containing protein n=1 Tax=Trichobilharzia regenti TaxID=157069 RepID=A0AA85JGZ7_TRIRE|nr:unnamed protein product [Trichobilharzia regenti]
MFSDLPVELLQYIFMLLSPCTDLLTVLSVCKRWRDVGRSVFRLRESLTLSAFKMQSPLQWMSPNLRFTAEKSKYTAPSKRFGATILVRGQLVYVFGGATRELTAFNDLWTFDLSTHNWKRIVGKGELPTPRAHAKGGFIGNSLYLYGGCQSFHRPGSEHTGHMDWLTELNSFDLSTFRWSRLPIFEVNHLSPVPPPAFAGQSGCFLPKGGVGEPSVLVLFGGISQYLGSCVSHLYVVSPENGCWISVSDAAKNSVGEWPSGRCGHSTSALDSNRMLLMFGNLESPLATDQPGRRQQMVNANHDSDVYDSEFSPYTSIYRGRPSGDIWILTRCSPNTQQDWYEVDWFWTKVECSQGIPGCPPIDFYHATAVSLPYREVNKPYVSTENRDFIQTNSCYSDNRMENVFTVAIISQPTAALLDEAAKQRKYWQRIKMSSELTSTSYRKNATDQISGMPADDGNEKEDLLQKPCHLADINPQVFHSDRLLSLPSSRRSNNRRARRLEALANQERKLFGSRNPYSSGENNIHSIRSHPSNHVASSHNICTSDSVKSNSASHPLAVYSLSITCCYTDNSIDSKGKFNHNGCTAKGVWLVPLKQNYLDLYFAPPECLGFSCTFGHDCLFLFGGLTGSDDIKPDEDVNSPSTATNVSISRNNTEHNRRANNLSTSSSSRSSLVNGSLTQGYITSRLNSTDTVHPNPLGIAQFFILSARSLAGTIV